MTLEICADADALARAAAHAIADHLRAEVAAHGEASLMLTGGTTPEKMHRVLRTLPLPWEKISIWFGDERAVGPDDDASNYKMAERSLLESIRPLGPQIERMCGEASDLEIEAERYAALLPEHVSLLLLGVGEDGHIASLFPGHAELDEHEHKVLVVRDSPKPPKIRLSIGPRVVANAKAIFVLAAGRGKAAALAAGLAAESPLPVALAKRGRFFLDAEAASQLPQGAQ